MILNEYRENLRTQVTRERLGSSKNLKRIVGSVDMKMIQGWGICDHLCRKRTSSQWGRIAIKREAAWVLPVELAHCKIASVTLLENPYIIYLYLPFTCGLIPWLLVNSPIEVECVTILNTTLYLSGVLLLAGTGFWELIVPLKWAMVEYLHRGNWQTLQIRCLLRAGCLTLTRTLVIKFIGQGFKNLFQNWCFNTNYFYLNVARDVFAHYLLWSSTDNVMNLTCQLELL